jgi:hypothetical protein
MLPEGKVERHDVEPFLLKQPCRHLKGGRRDRIVAEPGADFSDHGSLDEVVIDDEKAPYRSLGMTGKLSQAATFSRKLRKNAKRRLWRFVKTASALSPERYGPRSRTSHDCRLIAVKASIGIAQRKARSFPGSMTTHRSFDLKSTRRRRLRASRRQSFGELSGNCTVSLTIDAWIGSRDL